MNHGYIPTCIAAFSARESCDSLSVAVSVVSCMLVHAIPRFMPVTDFRECDLSPLTSGFSFSVFCPISSHVVFLDATDQSRLNNDAITILRRGAQRRETTSRYDTRVTRRSSPSAPAEVVRGHSSSPLDVSSDRNG